MIRLTSSCVLILFVVASLQAQSEDTIPIQNEFNFTTNYKYVTSQGKGISGSELVSDIKFNIKSGILKIDDKFDTIEMNSAGIELVSKDKQKIVVKHVDVHSTEEMSVTHTIYRNDDYKLEILMDKIGERKWGTLITYSTFKIELERYKSN